MKTKTKDEVVATIGHNENAFRDVPYLLDTATAEVGKWNSGSRNASKQDLYRILAKCLELLLYVREHHAYETLAKELKERNLPAHENTTLPTRIVRVVFNGESRSLARYAAVVKIAETSKIMHTDFVQWVTDQGGLDSIRKAAKDAAALLNPKPAPEEVRKAAKDGLLPSSHCLGNITADFTHLNHAKNDGYAVAILRKVEGDTYDVVGVTSDSSALRYALLDWGKHVINGGISPIVQPLPPHLFEVTE